MWVSSKDYLPDYSGIYLTCTHVHYSYDYSKYYTAYRVIEYDAFKKEWNTMNIDDEVIAWMEFDLYNGEEPK
jgi:hypothetical protein